VQKVTRPEVAGIGLHATFSVMSSGRTRINMHLFHQQTLNMRLGVGVSESSISSRVQVFAQY
jgi:hypothetical protein